MDIADARAIAYAAHLRDRDRFGDLVIEHVARVADAVPEDAQATAWLHEMLERTDVDTAELRAAGLTEVELAAVELLTRMPAEVYELYALRVAHAPGEEGRLARCVKLADLDDHLAHENVPLTAPPYAWARRHIHVAQLRSNGSSQAAHAGAA